jgi:protoporphyrinogen oxidase
MIAIIGAGISGLTVAKNLKKPFKIFEQNDHVGGISTQYQSGGFYFDYGGHYFHFQNKEKIKNYLFQFSSFQKYRRNSQIFLFDSFIPFPVQYHLSYFPSSLKKEIYQEILQTSDIKTNNLNEFLTSAFGRNLSKTFFFPFLQKYYQTDLASLAAGQDKGSIPKPDKKLIKSGLEGGDINNSGYNPFFYYPPLGMREFFKIYSKKLNADINLKEKVISIDLDARKIYTNQRSFIYSKLVDTMPLSIFLNSLIQKNQFQNSCQLRSTSTQVVNLVLKEKRRSFHWIYLPSKEDLFYRAGYYTNSRHHQCYLERTILPDDEYTQEDIFAKAKILLKKLGLIKSTSEIIEINSITIPVSYILIDNNWKTTIPKIIERLQKSGVESIGRYGGWKYSSMAEDVLYALNTAERLNCEAEQN